MEGDYMKAAIRHNLSLLIRGNMDPWLWVCIFLFMLLGRFYNIIFMLSVPTATAILVLSIKSFDEKNLKTLLSLPITRKDFAKAKFLTLIIVYAAVLLITLAMYIAFVSAGIIEPMDFLDMMIEISVTLPLSIIFGGITILFPGAMLLIFIFNISWIVVNMNIKPHIGRNASWVMLAAIIWFVVSTVSFAGIRKCIINKYAKVES